MTESPVGFWDWAVAAYGRDGVAPICLVLQDEHGQNVPLLLWAAWLATFSERIDSGLAARAVTLTRAWSDEVIVPLRHVRRRLKTTLHDGDDGVRLPLRDRVKAVELEAEKALMGQLEALVAPGHRLPSAVLPTVTLDALLQVQTAWSPQDAGETLAALCQALTKA